MAKCTYKHCRNEAEVGKTLCRAHQDGVAKDDVIPGFEQRVKWKVATTSPEFVRFQAYCDDAISRINAFLDDSDVADNWIRLFFGDDRADIALKVVQNMPEAVKRWKNTTNAKANPRFNVWIEPLYALTGTPNSCETGNTVDLTVAPKFLENGQVTDPSQEWVIVHESAHGVHLVKPELVNEFQTEGSKAFVADIHYEWDGPGFFALEARDRLVNADHYRAMIKAFVDNAGKIDDGVIRTFQVPNDRVRRVRGDSGAAVRSVRTITDDVKYPDYVRDAAAATFQSCWLFMYNVFNNFAGKYQRSAKVTSFKPSSAIKGMSESDVKKIALGGKKTTKMKIKDVLRLKDLYTVARYWVDRLSEFQFLSAQNDDVRGLESITLVKDGGKRTLLLTSHFRVNDVVDDAALRRGVRLVIEKILEDRSYPNIDVDEVIRMAQACHQSPGDWAADFNEW